MTSVHERSQRLRDRAQLAAETGGKEHPHIDRDPYEGVFALSEGMNRLPEEILESDGELYLLFMSYLSGKSEGHEIRRSRS